MSLPGRDLCNDDGWRQEQGALVGGGVEVLVLDASWKTDADGET